MGEQVSEIDEFLASLRLRHFAPDELLYATDRPNNAEPPRELWPNIALTATLLDELRESFGRAIRITSCYRAPSYNRIVGGEPRSQHLAWSAIDFQVSGVAPAIAAARLREWRGRLVRLAVQVERVALASAAGMVPFAPLPTFDERGGSGSVVEWKGGVGEYSTFVHVDSRGLNHSWTGR